MKAELFHLKKVGRLCLCIFVPVPFREECCLANRAYRSVGHAPHRPGNDLCNGTVETTVFDQHVIVMKAFVRCPAPSLRKGPRRGGGSVVFRVAHSPNQKRFFVSFFDSPLPTGVKAVSFVYRGVPIHDNCIRHYYLISLPACWSIFSPEILSNSKTGTAVFEIR